MNEIVLKLLPNFHWDQIVALIIQIRQSLHRMAAGEMMKLIGRCPPGRNAEGIVIMIRRSFTLAQDSSKCVL
jgi:hypothetical protein